MAADFPGAIVSLTNPTSGDDHDTVGVVHSVLHAKVNDEIEAIETELGFTPSGVDATVAARLDRIEDEYLPRVIEYTDETGDSTYVKVSATSGVQDPGAPLVHVDGDGSDMTLLRVEADAGTAIDVDIADATFGYPKASGGSTSLRGGSVSIDANSATLNGDPIATEDYVDTAVAAVPSKFEILYSQDEGPTRDNTALGSLVSVLDSAVTIAANSLASGDSLVGEGHILVSNNSGGNKAYTIGVLMGGSSHLKATQNVATAGTLDLAFRFRIRQQASGDQNLMLVLSACLNSGSGLTFSSSATFAITTTSSTTVDVQLRTSSSTGTQSAQLTQFTLAHEKA